MLQCSNQTNQGTLSLVMRLVTGKVASTSNSIRKFEVLKINIPFCPPEIPCHTQVLERGICVISEAATSVIGHEAPDGFIRQKMKSRKSVGPGHTKTDFYGALEPTMKSE